MKKEKINLNMTDEDVKILKRTIHKIKKLNIFRELEKEKSNQNAEKRVA